MSQVTKCVSYKCHNKFTRLKHHIALYSKLVTYLEVFLITINKCQSYVVALYTIINI